MRFYLVLWECPGEPAEVGVRIQSGFKGRAEAAAQRTKPQLSILLDIDEVNVLKIEARPSGDLHIRLESSLSEGYCRKCVTKLHSYEAWVKGQPLPILGHAVFVHDRPKG